MRSLSGFVVVSRVVLLFVLSAGVCLATTKTLKPQKDWDCTSDEGTALSPSDLIPDWALTGASYKVTALTDDDDDTYIYRNGSNSASDHYTLDDTFSGTATSIQVRVRGNRPEGQGWCRGLISLTKGTTSSDYFSLSESVGWASVTYTYSGPGSGWTGTDIDNLAVYLQGAEDVRVYELEVVINGTTTLLPDSAPDNWDVQPSSSGHADVVDDGSDSTYIYNVDNDTQDGEPDTDVDTFAFEDLSSEEFDFPAHRVEIWLRGHRPPGGPGVRVDVNLHGATDVNGKYLLPPTGPGHGSVCMTYYAPESGWTIQEINDMTVSLSSTIEMGEARVVVTELCVVLYSTTTPVTAGSCYLKRYPSSAAECPLDGDHEAMPDHVSYVTDGSNSTYLYVKGTADKSDKFAMTTVDLQGSNPSKIVLKVKAQRINFSEGDCWGYTNLPGATQKKYFNLPMYPPGIYTKSVTFNRPGGTTWTQDDIDSLLVTIGANDGTGNEAIRIYETWAVLYY